MSALTAEQVIELLKTKPDDYAMFREFLECTSEK
jgi:hypothetical protein